MIYGRGEWRNKRGGEEIFNRSKKTTRLPEVYKGEEVKIEKMMRRLTKKELREMIGEIKEGIREQREMLRREIKELKWERREREEVCRKENKKLKGGLRLLDKKVKKLKNRRIRTQ